jgi:hypothetical protein
VALQRCKDLLLEWLVPAVRSVGSRCPWADGVQLKFLFRPGFDSTQPELSLASRDPSMQGDRRRFCAHPGDGVDEERGAVEAGRR